MLPLKIVELLLLVAGSLTLFLFGMRVMNTALQRLSVGRFRNAIFSITSSPIKGFFTGFSVTTLVQSSSAVTVLTVGMASAGLLSIAGAQGVILGANLGTTITAWVISFVGFELDLGYFVVILAAFAFPLLFSKKPRRRSFGDVIIGFALMFISLSLLQLYIPSLRSESSLVVYLSTIQGEGLWSVLIFLFFGACATAIFQSSSAILMLILVLSGHDLIGLESAYAAVLGVNIGTTITANIASIFSTRSGRIVARFHTLFNLIGVSWVLFVFNWFSAISTSLSLKISGGVLDQAIAISLFHTLFNFSNILLQIGFLPALARISALMFVGNSQFATDGKREVAFKCTSESQVNIWEVHYSNNIVELCRTMHLMQGKLPQLLLEKRAAEFHALFDAIKADKCSIYYEADEILSTLKLGVQDPFSSTYLPLLLSTQALALKGKQLADELSESADLVISKGKEGLFFLPEMREHLFEMFDYVAKASLHIYRISKESSKPPQLDIDLLEEQLKVRFEYLKELNQNDLKRKKYTFKTGLYYWSLIQQMMKSFELLTEMIKSINEQKTITL